MEGCPPLIEPRWSLFSEECFAGKRQPCSLCPLSFCHTFLYFCMREIHYWAVMIGGCLATSIRFLLVLIWIFPTWACSRVFQKAVIMQWYSPNLYILDLLILKLHKMFEYRQEGTNMPRKLFTASCFHFALHLFYNFKELFWNGHLLEAV